MIKIAEPFFKLFEGSCSDRVLKGIAQIPEKSRQEVCNQAISLIKEIIESTTSKAFERLQSALNIEGILSFINDTQHLEKIQLDYLLSLAKQMKGGWDIRLEVMTLLKNVSWVPDPRENIYKTSISAPFNAEEVVRHALTKPEIYEMEFVESEAGKTLINEVINQLNAHRVPKDDFASLSMAYNRSSPNAGYNKSLIADYVSRLKAPADHKS